MAERILQVSYQFQATPAVYARAVESITDAVAAVPGLRWTIWLLNAAQHEAGGIYLFADEASLQAYLDGPIMAGLRSHPLLNQFHSKQFDLMNNSESARI